MAINTPLDVAAIIGHVTPIQHTSFLLLDGTSIMTGNLDLGGNNLFTSTGELKITTAITASNLVIEHTGSGGAGDIEIRTTNDAGIDLISGSGITITGAGDIDISSTLDVNIEDLVFSGSTITGLSTVDIGSIRIGGASPPDLSTIRTLSLNTNLFLQANGTGGIVINSGDDLTLVSGNVILTSGNVDLTGGDITNALNIQGQTTAQLQIASQSNQDINIDAGSGDITIDSTTTFTPAATFNDQITVDNININGDTILNTVAATDLHIDTTTTGRLVVDAETEIDGFSLTVTSGAINLFNANVSLNRIGFGNNTPESLVHLGNFAIDTNIRIANTGTVFLSSIKTQAHKDLGSEQIWDQGNFSTAVLGGAYLWRAAEVTTVMTLSNDGELAINKGPVVGSFNLDVTGDGRFTTGLIVNDGGTGTANDDLRVETNNSTNALLVDASADQIRMDDVSFVFNEEGNNHDSRFEGLADNNLLVTDAGRDEVYIGAAPGDGDSKLHIRQEDSVNPTLAVETDADNTTDRINFRHLQDDVITTNATPTTAQTIGITASRTYILESFVVGRRTGGVSGTADDGATYIIRSSYTTKVGTVTLLGAVQKTPISEDQAGFDANHVISGTNVLVQMTGAADNTLSWHVDTRIQFVGS